MTKSLLAIACSRGLVRVPVRWLAALFVTLVVVWLGLDCRIPRTKAAGVTAGRQGFKFDFGPGTVAPGYIAVISDQFYTRERSFGFEPGAKVS